MKIVVECTPKEIAALALELQERQAVVNLNEIADAVIHHLQSQQGPDR